MATYQLTQPAFILGRYYDADPRNPQVYEFPDEVEPSTTWAPVDAAAKAALEKLDKVKLEAVQAARQEALNPTKSLPPMPKPPKRELVATESTGAADEAATPDTHLRPAPPSVPGSQEQRPQDLGPKEGNHPPTAKQVKRASDKDSL